MYRSSQPAATPRPSDEDRARDDDAGKPMQATSASAHLPKVRYGCASCDCSASNGQRVPFHSPLCSAKSVQSPRRHGPVNRDRQGHPVATPAVTSSCLLPSSHWHASGTATYFASGSCEAWPCEPKASFNTGDARALSLRLTPDVQTPSPSVTTYPRGPGYTDLDQPSSIGYEGRRISTESHQRQDRQIPLSQPVLSTNAHMPRPARRGVPARQTAPATGAVSRYSFIGQVGWKSSLFGPLM